MEIKIKEQNGGNGLPKDKWGGNLKGDDIADKFRSLVNQKVVVEELVEQPDIITNSNNLKIVLTNYNENYKVSITVNSQVYIVGESIPSYIIYNESGTYVLDLKLVKEILNFNTEEWNNASIIIDYVRN